MQESGVDMPDAIITGTGLGCIEDTEKFLGSIIQNEERLLNPTPFIQSTHNTVAAAIALAVKCNNYNSTYVHRGFSFENALQDAMLFLKENPETNVLVGGLDEITENAYTITRRLGLWKKNPVNNLSLFNSRDSGSIPGEGISFFILGNHADLKSKVRIRAMDTFYKPGDLVSIKGRISTFLEHAGVELQDLDLVILGLNGDEKGDRTYRYLLDDLLKKLKCAAYKHLCGEYDTSVSFALWLANMIITQQNVPDVVKMVPYPVNKINHILIYNNLRNINHSLMLVSKC